MKYADRYGNRWDIDNKQDINLKNMYSSIWGRLFLRFLSFPIFSKIGGWFLNTSFSKRYIEKFVKTNNIDLSICEKQDFKSYNDFFTRKFIPSARPIDMTANHLISPCDSKLIVCPINSSGVFEIKDTLYTLDHLLQDNTLAKEFLDGYLLIFRLSVDDYHRYSYFDNGNQIFNKFIKGRLQTVNPIANDYRPIYKENSRELSIILTENFDKTIYMEVGAVMVGKISNHKKTGSVLRGEEKGMFEFGGSTIVLILKKDVVRLDEDIVKNSQDGYETKVKLGEKIGVKA